MEVINILCVFTVIYFITIVNGHWDYQNYQKKEHCLMRPYQGSGMTIPNWEILGSCLVTNDYIRLTPDAPSRQGGLWNTIPVQSPAWELHVQFKVHSLEDKLFGDGFVIWYTKDKSTLGPVFGGKDYFSGLGIFVDTYNNHNGPHKHSHPYISAMVNNGSLSYDHDTDGTHTQLAGCEVKFRNLNYGTYISIRYEKDVLTVSTDFDNKAGWNSCFSMGGVRLPTGYYIGVTAATGDLHDNHDIISIKFYELDTDQQMEDRHAIIPSAAVFEPVRDRVDDEKPEPKTVRNVFLCIVILVVVAVIGLVGIAYYQKYQERSRKRFY